MYFVYFVVLTSPDFNIRVYSCPFVVLTSPEPNIRVHSWF